MKVSVEFDLANKDDARVYDLLKIIDNMAFFIDDISDYILSGLPIGAENVEECSERLMEVLKLKLVKAGVQFALNDDLKEYLENMVIHPANGEVVMLAEVDPVISDDPDGEL